MFVKNCVSEVPEAGKKRRRGHMQLATDFGERKGKKVRVNVPEFSNSTFMVVIRRVLNRNNDPTSSMQFQASYTDVRQWEELLDLIENNCSLKEPYYLSALYKCNLTREELDAKYVGLYAPGK
jgi:hypothetical protein